jgi:CO/xanthine dehydrogenase Mo-binding subunit
MSLRLPPLPALRFGIAIGISMALHEDHDRPCGGCIVNGNLGEDHVPAHADIHDLQVIFVDEQDDKASRWASRAWAKPALSARRRR